MKKTTYFHLENENTIVVEGFLDNDPLLFLIDTGASNTCLDFNALYVADYDLSNPVDKVLIETANGIISTNVYTIKSLEILGIRKTNFPVQIIDFIERGITSEYDGILGLDFLQGTHFCIDTLHNEITIQ